MSDTARHRGLTGYLLLLPGILWLVVFFVIPFYSLLAASLYDPSGSDATGYTERPPSMKPTKAA